MYICLGDLFASEEVSGGFVILRKHIKGHGARLVVHGKERPFVLRQHFAAGELCTGYPDNHVPRFVYRERKTVAAYSVMEDRSLFLPVEPKLQGEVTTEEDGIDCFGLCSIRKDMIGHLMVYRPSVEFGGDNNILVAHITGHDVLVELDGKILAYT